MGYNTRIILRNQAMACRFAVYRLNAEGKPYGLPVTRHITEESAQKYARPMLDGTKCGVFPYTP
jgi:hypothetical protein